MILPAADSKQQYWAQEFRGRLKHILMRMNKEEYKVEDKNLADDELKSKVDRMSGRFAHDRTCITLSKKLRSP